MWSNNQVKRVRNPYIPETPRAAGIEFGLGKYKESKSLNTHAVLYWPKMPKNEGAGSVTDSNPRASGVKDAQKQDHLHYLLEWLDASAIAVEIADAMFPGKEEPPIKPDASFDIIYGGETIGTIHVLSADGRVLTRDEILEQALEIKKKLEAAKSE